MATRTLNRLSANLVKALAERGYYADGGGLYFRVSEFGTRLWAFRYTRAGKAREMGLGPYPEVTLKDARELALQARKLLRDDQDPIEKRQSRRREVAAERQAALTFAQCAAAFIAAKESEWKNAKHGEQWRTTLAICTAGSGLGSRRTRNSRSRSSMAVHETRPSSSLQVEWPEVWPGMWIARTCTWPRSQDAPST